MREEHDWIEIDGSAGEGGGQILRSSLALSIITGRPVHLRRIRAARSKPGLQRQHLTAVQAAARVSSAVVDGDVLGSTEVRFAPGPVAAGHHHFAVGTAGSTTLVLQTILWPLLCADGESHVVIEGGTHNPMAPTFEFVARTFLPAIARMGARVELTLERHGFHPAGGGRLRARILGGASLAPASMLERGEARGVEGRACVANLPISIAHREIDVVRDRLSWSPRDLRVERVPASGPGNVVLLATHHESGTTVHSAIGERRKKAEAVAQEACVAAQRFLDADVPVDEHLADQLLLGMALARGGVFRTSRPTLHATSNASVIERFLPVVVDFTEQTDRPTPSWRVEMRPATTG